MPEVSVVVRDPGAQRSDEHFSVSVGRLPGRGWWLNLEGGGVAEVQEVRTISGDHVAFAERRLSIPPTARTIGTAHRSPL